MVGSLRSCLDRGMRGRRDERYEFVEGRGGGFVSGGEGVGKGGV